MRLKLDENLGRQGAELLRQTGHDVTTVAEQGLKSAPDSALIEVCRTEGRCLVTLVKWPNYFLISVQVGNSLECSY